MNEKDRKNLIIFLIFILIGLLITGLILFALGKITFLTWILFILLCKIILSIIRCKRK